MFWYILLPQIRTSCAMLLLQTNTWHDKRYVFVLIASAEKLWHGKSCSSMPENQSKRVLKPRPPLPPSVWHEDLVQWGRRCIAKANETGEYQSQWAALEKRALQAEVAWVQRIHVDQVGVSPYNRGGLGVSGGDAQKHLVDINHLGFTWTKLEAKAKQTDQADPEVEVSFNESQVRLSKGIVPPLGMMIAVSLGGGHTNVGFRQAKHQVKALYKEIAAADGHIDLAKLTAGKPEVSDAITNGLMWTLFHWQCEDAWPGFSDFAQKALNTTAQSLRRAFLIFISTPYPPASCFSKGSGMECYCFSM